jgi:hypothetical protein
VKRLISIVILTSILAFGALNAAMGAGFAHASMEGGSACMDASCPASETGGMQQAMDCIDHCIAAVSPEYPAVPLLPALFVVALLLLLAGQSPRPVVEDGVRSFTDIIGRLLLRQRLASVVMRN